MGSIPIRLRRTLLYGDPLKISLRALRLLVSIAGVAVITFIASTVIPVNATTAGFAYLLYVLLIASTWGFLEASMSSVAATLAFNFFFFPPVGTFTIADPQNWVALFTFLATSLIASRLSTAAKRRALDAMERQQDLERLYTFGRAILLIDSSEPFAKQLTKRLAETFELNAAALYEPRIWRDLPRRSGSTSREWTVNSVRQLSKVRLSLIQNASTSSPRSGLVLSRLPVSLFRGHGWPIPWCKASPI